MTWPPTVRAALGLTDDNPLMKCGCGRETNADMMIDVRPLPGAVRGTAEYLCDACVETVFRTKRMTRVAFNTALGAPPAVVAKAARRDAADV
ncbi:MAG: hypothetical protein ACSLFE_00425 [Gemmatimonadaceae bacterium]